MKIFMIWSGTTSKRVAELLSGWIMDVLQRTETWISTQDLDRGATWSVELSEKLSETTVGIVCLTKENRSSLWIPFEAGAISKGMVNSRVYTILIDLQERDVKYPLALFNHTIPSRDGMKTLVQHINRQLGDSALPVNRLERYFHKFWPEFEEELSKIVAQGALSR